MKQLQDILDLVPEEKREAAKQFLSQEIDKKISIATKKQQEAADKEIKDLTDKLATSTTELSTMKVEQSKNKFKDNETIAKLKEKLGIAAEDVLDSKLDYSKSEDEINAVIKELETKYLPQTLPPERIIEKQPEKTKVGGYVINSEL